MEESLVAFAINLVDGQCIHIHVIETANIDRHHDVALGITARTI